MTSIYVLRDPTTLEVRYLGKTKQDPKRRLSKHVSTANTEGTHKAAWILTLPTAPILEVVEVTDGDGCDLEIRWISMLLEMGYDLTNTSAGGEPGWSDEARAAIPRGPLRDDTKAKISEALMGHDVSEETKQKIRTARTRQVIRHNENTKAKIAESLKGHQVSEEARKKMSEARKRYWAKRKGEPL